MFDMNEKEGGSNVKRSERMNICFVVAFGRSLAGSQQSLLNLIDNLDDQDMEFYIGCHKDWELIEIFRKKGMETKIVKARTSSVSRKNFFILKGFEIFAPIIHFYNFLHINRAANFLKSKNIDIVHINTTLASDIWAEAAIKSNIPYIYHIREFLTEDHDRDFWDKKYSYKLLEKSYCNIAITDTIKRFWSQKASNDYRLIYNGLPKNEYYIENNIIFDKEVVTCIIIGRIRASKGQMDAVKAIEYLLSAGISNVYLKIVGYRGRDNYEKELKKYIDDKGLNKNISLIDYSYDLTQYRASCDIGLIGSKAEAFGRVTIENMLAGLLTIGTNSGGTPELIEHGKTGFLYEYGNYIQLAKLIQFAINNRDTMKKIALEGQNNALQNFSIEKTAQSVKKLYNEILQKIK